MQYREYLTPAGLLAVIRALIRKLFRQGRRLCLQAGPGLKGTALCFVFALLMSPAAQAGWPVFDAQNWMENMLHKVAAIEEWGVDNQKQIEHLQEMQRTNEWAKVNTELHNSESWQDIERIEQQTMVMVQASRTLWQELETFASYVEIFKQAEAWEKCFKAKYCDFGTYLEQLDDLLMVSAREAAFNAGDMQEHMQQKAETLKALSAAGRKAQGQADLLDNLSRINTETAASLIDLNTQTSALLQMLGNEFSARSSRQQGLREQSRAFRTSKGTWHHEHVDLRIRP